MPVNKLATKEKREWPSRVLKSSSLSSQWKEDRF